MQLHSLLAGLQIHFAVSLSKLKLTSETVQCMCLYFTTIEGLQQRLWSLSVLLYVMCEHLKMSYEV